MVKPKKYLGQHFLTDPGISKKIAGAIKNPNHLPVLEIGPGKGILTKQLLDIHETVWAVETDGESIEYLKEHLPELEERLIHGDFLKINLHHYFPSNFCVVGNLPYNISSPILFNILNNKAKITECAFMLQKEVARRICSPHGSKEYGILSVLIQTYYDAEYLFTVNEGSFFPPPKVKSGVFRLTKKENPEVPKDADLHKKLIKAAFNQRRKTMRNSLKGLQLNLPHNAKWLNLRPEQCSVSDFIKISNQLSEENHAI